MAMGILLGLAFGWHRHPACGTFVFRPSDRFPIPFRVSSPLFSLRPCAAPGQEPGAGLCHAPALEEAFVREGYSQDRRRVANNDFVIVGPANDPADVRQAHSGAAALAKIAAARQPFVSRGDHSGTHLKEQDLWLKA